MGEAERLIQEYKEKRSEIEGMGGPEAVQKRHDKGQLTARERMDLLFDPDTFTEIGLFVKHRGTKFGLDRIDVPAEGVVTGYGLVNSRWVVAFAEDYTAMAGTFGEYHGLKEIRAIELARQMGCPVIGMNDSGGARLQEGIDTLEMYGKLFRTQIEASGIIPQIALLMGPCLGGQAYHPIMQDFIIQCRDTGLMGIAGPAFVKAQLGEEISLQELCGWRSHATKAGQTHVVATDDRDAIEKAKELLSFLPSNNMENPVRQEAGDDPLRSCPDLDSVMPDRPSQPYDMHKIIGEIVDDGHFFELMEGFAKNVITGFARFGGRPVGIWANQPMWAGGVIDCDAADKGARFIRFCDLFNIPVISLGDCPGYMIGSDQEWKGILRHGAKLLYAWAGATIPLISIIVGKSYAGAHYGMLDKSIGADLVFAWPTSRVTIVGAETAASVIFAREIRQSDNPEATRTQRIQEYAETYENPYRAAERGYVDEIIVPRDTRRIINRALDLIQDKNKNNKLAQSKPWKKYNNINL